MAARRRPLKYYLDLSYPFVVAADPEGGFVISFPDLPGCTTQVESTREIGPMAEDARRLWIETEYAEGEEIPMPAYPEPYSGKFNVRLPKSLHRRLAERATGEGVSLNQYLVSLLASVSGAPRELQSPASSRRGIRRANRSANSTSGTARTSRPRSGA